MTTKANRVSAIAILSLCLALASPAVRAAGEQALVKQVAALDAAAAAAYKRRFKGAPICSASVAQPAIRAKTIVFYYRPPSSAVYNAVVMDPTRRGWSRAVITANELNGKLLQYYAEVRDSNDSVAATNGKATSPNVVTIMPARMLSR